MARQKKHHDPFRWFDSSPEVIRLVVMKMYVRYPLSLRNVEDLLFERGIDICHETVRLCPRSPIIRRSCVDCEADRAPVKGQSRPQIGLAYFLAIRRPPSSEPVLRSAPEC